MKRDGMMRGICAAGAAVVLLAGLGGCGQAAEKAIEEGVEQGTGADTDIGDGGIKFDDGEGNEISVGGKAELPASWPDVVPTPDGQLMVGAASANGGANGVWEIDAPLNSAFDDYAAQLAGAGFTEEDTFDLGGGRTTKFAGNGFEVAVVAAESDGKTSLNVSVLPTN